MFSNWLNTLLKKIKKQLMLTDFTLFMYKIVEKY